MSLSQAERERWAQKINRLNAQGWAEDKRRRVQAIQASNPGMSFETAWSKAEREEQNPAPEPTTIGEAANLIKSQRSGLTFQQCWNLAEGIYPALVRNLTAEENRVVANQAPQLERAKWKAEARIEAHARGLMSQSRGRMTFGEALQKARAQLVEARSQTDVPAGPVLVTAQYSVSLDGHLPAAIQYMPGGKATINPNVNGVPREITVTVTPHTAAVLQADLTKLLSQNVRPYVDFDHAGGAAAAIPRRFFWRDDSGVMLRSIGPIRARLPSAGATIVIFHLRFCSMSAGIRVAFRRRAPSEV